MAHNFSNLEYDYKTAKTEDLLYTFRTLRIIQANGVTKGCPCCYGEGFDELEPEDQKRVDEMVVAMKAELATRPHVPNKKEKKEMRRLKAQGKYVRE